MSSPDGNQRPKSGSVIITTPWATYHHYLYITSIVETQLAFYQYNPSCNSQSQIYCSKAFAPVFPAWMWHTLPSKHAWHRCETHLEVLQGELQHVSEDITEDLRLPLHQHIFIVQRLDHLRFHLENTDEALCYWDSCKFTNTGDSNTKGNVRAKTQLTGWNILGTSIFVLF